jgi:hypothetical protein
MPAVRKIVRDAAADDYRFSALVRGIVDSDQFRKRRVPEPAASRIAAQNATEAL